VAFVLNPAGVNGCDCVSFEKVQNQPSMGSSISVAVNAVQFAATVLPKSVLKVYAWPL